jgi:hypothetical protein
MSNSNEHNSNKESAKELRQASDDNAKIQRGLDEAARGIGIPLKEVDQKLRTKHKIPRR